MARFGSVGILTGHPISGSGLGVPINEDGSYTIDFLGPYEWPLLFEAVDQAAQWSGQIGNRFGAQLIAVTAGAATTYDFTFKAPVTINVQAPPQTAWVLFYNAGTGDIMGAGSGYPDNQITELMAGPQNVKLQVWPETGGSPYWVGGPDFASATTYRVPSSGPRTFVIPS